MEVSTYFDNIQEQVLFYLGLAKKSIKIAVTFFDNKEIFDAICEKAQENLLIELIISGDGFKNDKGGINFDLILKSGGKLFISIAENGTKNHNKFCIIDDNRVISGCYNWSSQTANCHENILVIEGINEITLKFLNEYENIKGNSVERKSRRHAYLLKSGIETFDEMFGGFHSGALTVIVSNFQNELTNFMLWIVNQSLQNTTGKIAFISLIEDNVKSANRLLSINSGIPLFKIIMGSMSEVENHILRSHGLANLTNRNLILKELQCPSLTQLKQELNILRYKYNLQLCVFDQIERVSFSDTETADADMKMLELCTLELKRLALEMNIPIVISNFLKNQENRNSLVTDSSEFAIFESYTDSIFGLNKSMHFNFNESSGRVTYSLNCYKNRHGTLGAIPVDENVLSSIQ